jgi:small GTP-binding protein
MFKIAIIGRPNVGKSTLFNALTNKNLAIVEDIQGTTRDRKISKGSLIDIDFELIDTGGFIKDNTMLTEDIWKTKRKSYFRKQLYNFYDRRTSRTNPR